MRGDVVLPAGSKVALAPLGLFAAETAEGADFKLAGAFVRVHVFERTYVEASSGSPDIPTIMTDVDTVPASYPLTNVSISLDPSGLHEGWFGIYPGADTFAELSTSRATSISSRLITSVGNAPGNPEDGASPEHPFYSREFGGRHIFLAAAAEVNVTGSLSFKAQGPDFLVVAAENSTTLATGVFRSSTLPARQTVERWVTFEIDQAAFAASLASPIEIAARAANIAWSGEARFSARAGSLIVDDARYDSIGGSVRLDGDFEGAVIPVMHDGELGLDLSVVGRLERTTLARKPLIVTAEDDTGWSLGFVVALGAVAAGGLTLGGAYLREKRRSRGFSLEELVQFANLAAEACRFGEALDWIRRARKLAPRSARLAMDEAFYLSSIGDVDPALERYAEASTLAKDGEADFLAAALVLTSGRDAAEAEARLDRALERSPKLLFEVEMDDAFARLRGRPRFARIMRKAEQRVRTDG